MTARRSACSNCGRRDFIPFIDNHGKAYQGCAHCTILLGPKPKPRWRVGAKLGRTLYRDEVFVGTVDTREIAEEIVRTMNGAGERPAKEA